MSDSTPRVSVRTILAEEGLGRSAGDKGVDDDKIAKGLASAADMSQGEFLGAMQGGRALGQGLGFANKKQVTRSIAQPYASVVRAMVVTMTSGPSGLTAATDTRAGAFLEGSLPGDLLSGAGTVAFDIVDRGNQGTEVVGASEIKGQAFAWGKGERLLNDLIDKAEQLARRY
jgi:hypothetical protein